MARKTGLWSLSWGWRARNMCRGEHNSQYWPNSSTRQGLRTYSFPWACYMKLDCLIPLATKNLFCCLHFIPYLNWCHLLSILGLSGNNNISEYPTGLCMLALFFRHDLPNFLCNCYCFFISLVTRYIIAIEAVSQVPILLPKWNHAVAVPVPTTECKNYFICRFQQN